MREESEAEEIHLGGPINFTSKGKISNNELLRSIVKAFTTAQAKQDTKHNATLEEYQQQYLETIREITQTLSKTNQEENMKINKKHQEETKKLIENHQKLIEKHQSEHQKLTKQIQELQ